MPEGIVQEYLRPYGTSDRSRDEETNTVTLDLQRHNHAASRVYPKLAAPIQLISGAGSYEEGIAFEVVPNNTINTEWDMHDVFVSVVGEKDVDYIITFYNNNNDNNVAEAIIRLSSNVSAVNVSYAKSSPIPANTGIYAKAAVENGGSKTIDIKIQYDLTGAA